MAYKPHMAQGMKGGLHSIWKWLVPYGTYSWRAQPFFAFCFFLFHVRAILVPIFLIGHNIVSRKPSASASRPCRRSLPTTLLTVGVIIAAIFITLRRVALTEVRILTRYDPFILALATLALHPTGFVPWDARGLV